LHDQPAAPGTLGKVILRTMSDLPRPTLRKNVKLLIRIWMAYLRVVRLSRRPLPEQIEVLQRRSTGRSPEVTPEKLSRAIHRGLRLGPIAPRCLPKALVMFEILRGQGDAAELVIGLPRLASSHEAHAWVELHAVDVGPPPGRAGHDELARYPS